MAVTMADITKLRKMTGAGMMDCKNALTDAEGDFDKAMKIIREKGQAVAAKRSDREASEGCVLVKVEEGFGAIIALKCETDFVAQNADFVKLTQDILDAAVANKCKTLEEVLALPMGDATVCPSAASLALAWSRRRCPRRCAQYSRSETWSPWASSRLIWFRSACSHISMTATRRCRSMAEVQRCFLPASQSHGLSMKGCRSTVRTRKLPMTMWTWIFPALL